MVRRREAQKSRPASRLFALALAVAVSTTACISSSDVSSLASTSAQVADELKAVYESLAQASDDTLTLRTAAATLGVTAAVDTVDLETIKSELGHRIELASALGGLFKSLANLAGSKVSEPAATAAGNIGSSLQKLGVVRKSPDPQKVLTGVAQIFFAWRTNEDLKSALQQTQPSVRHIAEFYKGEIDAYGLITHDDEEALATFRIKLIDLGLVAPESILRILAEPYGAPFGSAKCVLTPTPTAPAPTRDACLKAMDTLAKTLIQTRATRLETALNGAVAAMGDTLNALADGYQSLLSGGSARSDLIDQYLARTKAHLQEAAQLRPMAPAQMPNQTASK